jgi:glucose-6-phosphate isomerase
MSVTASRFGSSPLLFDWSGLTPHLKQNSTDQQSLLGTAWDNTVKKLHDRVSGFYDCPIDPSLSQVEACEALAKKLSTKNFKDCVFIGIGGSSLGPMCLIDSLKHLAKNPIQFHFFENPDPIDWSYRIQKLNPSHTLVCVVTKSGTTYETLSIFMLAFDWLKKGLGEQGAIENTVAITDPEKSELLDFAREKGISTLSISSSVGGRYSVFTPVGLFAAALAGLDTTKFISGAKKIRDYCEKHNSQSEKNNFIQLASALQTLERSHPIHVMMPYSTPIRLVANWWVQLWAESLGKNGKGFTAVPSLGAVDQHSMLQLLRDGPNDKIIWFMNVQDFEKKITIPSIGFKSKTFDLLEKQDLGTLLDTEFRAIQKVMTNQKRPNLQLQIDSLNEEAMGAVFFFFCVLTSFMGEVMNVNPFDQPGVEEGKIYIQDSLKKQKEISLSNSNSDDEVHRLRLNRE